MKRAIILAVPIAVTLATPLLARDPLGVFNAWGAFRDKAPHRCYAIAQPDPIRSKGDWRPFASVATWPERGVRNQIHIRLRKNRKPDTPVTLSIGPQKFELVGGKADAWAPSPRADAGIVRAMRSGEWMIVKARAEKGGGFVDSYKLRGLATAIDAATVACVRR